MSSLKEIATIQIRRDTAGNWTSNNPTPLQGEWCLETDTGYTKIGDGSTAWTSLRYNVGPAYDDIRISALAGKLGVGAPPDFTKILDNGAGSTGIFTYLFDKTTEQQLYLNVQMPHDWRMGTTIEPHVHWSPVANGVAGRKVSWGLEYSLSEIGSTFPNTTIIYGNTHMPAETLVADRHYLTDLTDINMSAVTTVSAMLICRIFRDAGGTGATDDYDNDAALLEIDFHYQRDDLGSRTEYIK